MRLSADCDLHVKRGPGPERVCRRRERSRWPRIRSPAVDHLHCECSRRMCQWSKCPSHHYYKPFTDKRWGSSKWEPGNVCTYVAINAYVCMYIQSLYVTVHLCMHLYVILCAMKCIIYMKQEWESTLSVVCAIPITKCMYVCVYFTCIQYIQCACIHE